MTLVFFILNPPRVNLVLFQTKPAIPNLVCSCTLTSGSAPFFFPLLPTCPSFTRVFLSGTRSFITLVQLWCLWTSNLLHSFPSPACTSLLAPAAFLLSVVAKSLFSFPTGTGPRLIRPGVQPRDMGPTQPASNCTATWFHVRSSLIPEYTPRNVATRRMEAVKLRTSYPFLLTHCRAWR
ncbi:hypothetical protein BC827DRAFT_422555 [Russula dissimulans]|nr:hypothetical protein BC827DRAFT_422555 [Russula dissimulans]